MKKFILLLILFGAYFSSQTSNAQMYCETYIEFKDALGNNYYPIPQVIITHSDSATHSANPITNFMGKAERPYGYLDSFILDTSMHDTDFTVNYFACGQWYSIDASYTKEYPNSWLRNLTMTITLPCVRPCNAAFYVSDYRLQYWGEYDFQAGQYGGTTQHEWHLGNGQIRSSENTSASYDTVGTVFIKHIMRDTVRGCVDSSIQILPFPADCNAGFYKNNNGFMNMRFTALRNNSSYSNHWLVDSVLVDSGGIFEHKFTSPGYHTVTLINSYQTQCADTATQLILANPQSCVIGMTYSKNNHIVTFEPDLLYIPYHYDFGDGDTGTYTGAFTHTYPIKSWSYLVVINDAKKECNQRTITLSIALTCDAKFTTNNPSNFVLSVNNNPVSNFTSRYKLSTGDSIIGNSGTFQINSPGTYSVTHDLYDANGLVHCTESKQFWVNSCGSIGNAPYDVRILGDIRFNGQQKNDYDSLRTYLIEYDSSAGTLIAVDSLTLYSAQNDSVYYAFTLPCNSAANYLVKAALLPGSKYYANYLPTYSISSSTWSNARLIRNPGYHFVDLIEGTNPGGPGFIGGLISQGANKKFKPLSGIQVNLFNDQGDPVAYTYSDANGAYSFDNITFRKYQVIVEELGKTSASYWVTLDANNPKVEDRNFEVNSTYVTILNTGISEPTLLTQHIYPNPAHDRLFVEWTENHAPIIQVSFYALDGRLLKSENIKARGVSQSELDISQLPQGLVMMRIQDGNVTQTIKLQIQ